MLSETPLFFNESPDKPQMVFFAGFHIGIPFSILGNLQEGIAAEFGKSHKFMAVKDEYAPSVGFPLGKPLILKYSMFGQIFNWKNLSKYASDHLIWICQSGILLIIGRVFYDGEDRSFDKKEFNRNVFDDIVDDQMANLTYIFSEVAEIIYKASGPKVLESVRCCSTDIEKAKDAIKFRKKYPHLETCGRQWETISQNETDMLLDTLIDVYYCDYNLSIGPDGDGGVRISYICSSISGPRPQYILIIAIAYSCFVGLLAFQKFIGEKVRKLRGQILKRIKTSDSVTAELKLLGAFCLEFIDVAEPTRIHLQRDYMECVSKCWGEYRLFDLSAQLRRQILTMDTMIEWVDQRAKEYRNLQIGFAAVILALISILAVSAQLISTLDYANHIGQSDRLLFILLGFLLGLVFTATIVYLPLGKIFSFHKKSDKDLI